MLPLMVTSKKQSFSCSEVHRTEDDTTSVPTRDEHTRWLAASGPIRTQRRKEKQICLVFRQKHTARRQVPDSPANSLFFYRALDREPTRIVAVSRRNPVVSTHGVSCGQRTSGRCTFPTDLEVAERSSSRQSNQVPLVCVSGSLATIPRIPRSKKEVVPNGHRHAMTQDPKILGTVQSNGRYSGDLHATCAKSPSRIGRDHIPRSPASYDTTEHPVNSSIAVPTDDAGELTNAVSSRERPRLPKVMIYPRNRV